MSDTYQILINGTALDAEIYSVLGSVVVEEHADLPGALQLTLPIAGDGNGDITRINDSNFSPYAKISVVVTPDGGGPQCIFDGYVLSQKIMLDRGLTKSTLEVWGQDIVLLDEPRRDGDRSGQRDRPTSTVASSIFGSNNITPADDNAADDPGASHVEGGHSLMQRATDIQFLRLLAKRSGKLCRVACADKPGAPVGYFAKPNLNGAPVATLTMNDPQQVMVNKLEIEWDVTRPTDVDGWQALFDQVDRGRRGERPTRGSPPPFRTRPLSDVLAQGDEGPPRDRRGQPGRALDPDGSGLARRSLLRALHRRGPARVARGACLRVGTRRRVERGRGGPLRGSISSGASSTRSTRRGTR